MEQLTSMTELSLSFDKLIPYKKDKAPLILE